MSTLKATACYLIFFSFVKWEVFILSLIGLTLLGLFLSFIVNLFNLQGEAL